MSEEKNENQIPIKHFSKHKEKYIFAASLVAVVIVVFLSFNYIKTIYERSFFSGGTGQYGTGDIGSPDSGTSGYVFKYDPTPLIEMRNICAILTAFQSLTINLQVEMPEGWPKPYIFIKGEGFINRDFLVKLVELVPSGNSEYGGCSMYGATSMHTNFPTLSGQKISIIKFGWPGNRVLPPDSEMSEEGLDDMNNPHAGVDPGMNNNDIRAMQMLINDPDKIVDCSINVAAHIEPVSRIEEADGGYKIITMDTSFQDAESVQRGGKEEKDWYTRIPINSGETTFEFDSAGNQKKAKVQVPGLSPDDERVKKREKYYEDNYVPGYIYPTEDLKRINKKIFAICIVIEKTE